MLVIFSDARLTIIQLSSAIFVTAAGIYTLIRFTCPWTPRTNILWEYRHQTCCHDILSTSPGHFFFQLLICCSDRSKCAQTRHFNRKISQRPHQTHPDWAGNTPPHTQPCIVHLLHPTLLDLAIIGAPLLLYDDAEDVDYNPMSKIFNDDFMTSNETA